MVEIDYKHLHQRTFWALSVKMTSNWRKRWASRQSTSYLNLSTRSVWPFSLAVNSKYQLHGLPSPSTCQQTRTTAHQRRPVIVSANHRSNYSMTHFSQRISDVFNGHHRIIWSFQHALQIILNNRHRRLKFVSRVNTNAGCCDHASWLAVLLARVKATAISNNAQFQTTRKSKPNDSGMAQQFMFCHGVTSTNANWSPWRLKKYQLPRYDLSIPYSHVWWLQCILNVST